MDQTILDQQLSEYTTQAEQLRNGLQQLETEYSQKKEQGIATLNQLLGAVQALTIFKDSVQANNAKGFLNDIGPIVEDAVPTTVEDALTAAANTTPLA